MGANNNTTSLNMGGTIGTRNFSDYTTRQISSSISRSNYRSKLVTDERLQKFREAVYRLVSGWAKEDKLLIISEYGDSSLLGKNPSEETINRVCTESLIIHLDPGDLEKLYNDVMITRTNLKKDVAKIQAKKKGKKLNISNFEAAYTQVRKAKNAQQYLKARKDFDGGFKVPKNIEKQYGKLRRELADVLKTCYNVVEVTGIAFSMGIEVYEDMSPKELYAAIINKTCLYVDLIVGKSKNGIQLSGAFMDSKPYDDLLTYTSYSYISGKPGMDPTEWARLKNRAREAKRAIAERARMQKSRAKFNSRDFRSVSGVRGNNLNSVARQLRRNDNGVLADVDFEKLLELAGKYGIDPSKAKNEGRLKALIYSAMAAENKRIHQLERQGARGGNFSKMRRTNDLLNVHRRFDSTSNEDIGSLDIPIITLSKTGMVKEESILRAVPVYLVGMSGAGDQPGVAGNNRTTTGPRSVMNGVTRGKASINKLNVISIDELNQKDQDTLNFIMNLPELSGSTTTGRRSIARSLTELQDQLLEDGVYQSAFDRYEQYYGIASERPGSGGADRIEYRTNVKRKYMAWLYFYLKRNKKAMSYIENNYRVPTFKVGGIRRGIKKGFSTAGNILLGITTLGIGNLIKAIGKASTKVGEKRRTFRDPRSEADLPDRDKAALKELQQYDVSQLKAVAAKYGYNAEALRNMEMSTTNSETVRWAFMAIIATAKGYKILTRYCEYKGELRGNATYRTLRRSRRNVFRNIATTFRILKNQAVIGNKPSMTPDEGTNNNYNYNPTNNIGQRLPIPKVNYLGDGRVDTNSILEVIPVYVVNTIGSGGSTTNSNQTVSGTNVNVINGDINATIGKNSSNNAVGGLRIGDVITNKNKTNTKTSTKIINNTTITGGGGGGETEKFTEGIGGNTSGVADYQRNNGQEVTKGDNKIKFTKDAATILAEMQSRGYTPTSRFITGKKAKAGRQYTVSTADLKWAKDNNFKFASGGYSFITGDSLNDKPNPELVTIKGDGSFSVNPLKSSSANGNSDFALDKFATGGQVDNRGLRLLSPYEKLQRELQFISAKNQLIAAAGTMGLNADDFGIASAKKPGELERINKRMLKAYKKKQKEDVGERENSIMSHEARSAGINMISKDPVQAVYVVNKSLGTDDGSIKGSVDLVKSSVEMNMSNLMSSLGGPWTVAAPMGAGAIVNPLMVGTGIADKIMDTAVDVMDTAKSVLGQTMFSTGGSITKAATGASIRRTGRAIPRFATGGGANIITGDAMGNNIFAGGAKPELVQSNGDMTVTPLNKAGTEQRYKVSRMTSTERKSALATAISSHIIKYNYTLPSEASEVSNAGEAIKVFNVKPGITDIIDVAGEQTTLAALLANIYGQLALIAGNTGTGNQLLSTIAAKPVANVSTSGGGGGGDANPFAGGFPSSLDSILGGE